MRVPRQAIDLLTAIVLAPIVGVWLLPHWPLLDTPEIAGVGLDRWGLLLVLAAGIWLLLRRVPLLSYGVLSTMLLVATWQGFKQGEGALGIFRQYGASLATLARSTTGTPDVMELRPFKGAEELRNAMDYREPEVRSFAVRAATTWFREEAEEGDRTLIQSFSVFKVINSAWVYVSDPMDEEYFAKASESMQLLAGDCDDHAVLMAACIRAIGGKVRLVRTTGHIYPEMNVGDQQGLQRAVFLIRNVLFQDKARYADLYYHIDANGDCWINLDYTRHYPGGPVMDERIIGILHV